MSERLVRFYHRSPVRTCGVSHSLLCHVALGRAVRGSGLYFDYPTVTIVRQGIVQVAGQCGRNIALVVLPQPGIGRGVVRVVTAGLAVSVIGGPPSPPST